MSAGWEVNDNMRQLARSGTLFQASVHGLDMSDPKIVAFIEHEIEVKAHMIGESIWLRRIINEQMGISSVKIFENAK